MADVTREEFESRVGVLEQEVEGEKLVTRHILDKLGATATTSPRLRPASIALKARSMGSIKRSIGWIARSLISSACCPKRSLTPYATACASVEGSAELVTRKSIKLIYAPKSRPS